MNNENRQPQIVVVHKASTIASFLEDTFTFVGFIALMWFNHAFLAGNAWIDVLFIALWMSFAMSMQSSRVHKFESDKQAIEWLESRL